MTFLIDECLHTSLARVAHDFGFAADHVNFLGLQAFADWVLMPRIVNGNYVFVTNDRADFLHLYAKRKLHPGLIIIVPNVAPKEQARLFLAALEYTNNRDLTNTVFEIHKKMTTIEIREYVWPFAPK